jgi:hypothetical protein
MRTVFLAFPQFSQEFVYLYAHVARLPKPRFTPILCAYHANSSNFHKQHSLALRAS